MKTLILAITSLAFFGCANGTWNTGSASTNAALTAAQAALAPQVLALANSVAKGSHIKTALAQASGDAVRSLEGVAITAAAPIVAQQVSKWVPKNPAWSGYAHSIGGLVDSYVKDHGNNQATLNAALEAVAMTLNNY